LSRNSSARLPASTLCQSPTFLRQAATPAVQARPIKQQPRPSELEQTTSWSANLCDKPRHAPGFGLHFRDTTGMIIDAYYKESANEAFLCNVSDRRGSCRHRGHVLARCGLCSGFRSSTSRVRFQRTQDYLPAIQHSAAPAAITQITSLSIRTSLNPSHLRAMRRPDPWLRLRVGNRTNRLPDRYQHECADRRRRSHCHHRCRRLPDRGQRSCSLLQLLRHTGRYFTVTWPGKKKPPVYSDWEVEEALDIEWAHSMAPKAKLFLVESVLCQEPTVRDRPTWAAIQLGAKTRGRKWRRRHQHELWRFRSVGRNHFRQTLQNTRT